MADNTKYGNAVDFDVDLHSIYAAYIGLFESSGTDWWEKSWGGYFTTFGDFLGFGWEVMAVVDTDTGRPHIAVRREQIGLFARMIRTRFGESLSKDPPTTLPLRPAPTRTLALRRLITLTDLAQYRKLALTLPAAELNYLRLRMRNAEVEVAEQLFYAGDNQNRVAGVRDNGVGYTWACVSTTWWEKGGSPSGLVPGSGHTRGKGKGSILEVGMAVVRCANLRAVSVWPPVPQENYRKSHFIAEEWVDKRTNNSPPNHPRAYAFGKSRYVAEKDLEKIVDATIGALASQENDSNPNTLILLTVGDPLPLPVPSSSTLPSNILHLDILALEHRLLRRAQEQGIPGTPDRQQPLPSLVALLQVLQIPVPPFVPIGNAGNEAFYTVLAFQKLMMAETRLPDVLFSPVVPDYRMGVSQSGFIPPSAPFAYPVASRRSSDASPRNSQMLPGPVDTSSPRKRTPSGRPLSMGDTLVQSARTSPRDPNMPEEVRRMDSTPPGMRQTSGRANTVFWDDSEFAPSGSDHRPPMKSRLASFDTERGRSAPAPASRGHLSASASSRSISWGGDIDLDPPQRPDMSARSRSAASSPARRVQDASSTSLNKAGSSSAKLSVDSGSSASAEKPAPASKAKGKLKSEKSVKDMAGALARFWVG